LVGCGVLAGVAGYGEPALRAPVLVPALVAGSSLRCTGRWSWPSAHHRRRSSSVFRWRCCN